MLKHAYRRRKHLELEGKERNRPVQKNSSLHLHLSAFSGCRGVLAQGQRELALEKTLKQKGTVVQG